VNGEFRMMKYIRRIFRALVLKTPIKRLLGWSVAYSIWPVHMVTSCCGVEFAAMADPLFDSERTGLLPFTSPRQTDAIILEGSLSRKMARAVKLVYEQMQEPKYVISMGACSMDGGVFYNSYNLIRAREVLPVDFYVPGCPPRPEGVIRSIVLLQKKIKEGKGLE